MGQIILEQRELTEKFGEGITLGDLIHKVENELKTFNEVVCQFKVNGIALAEADELRLSATPIHEIETLEVFSRKPSEILHEVVHNWVQEIPKLIASNDKLSQDIRFKGVEGHLKQMVDLIDNCQLLVESIMSIDSLFGHFQVIKSQDWKEAQKLSAAAIGEALACFQKKEFNQLADVLEYDLGHSLQTWLEILNKLAKEIAEGK